MFDPFYLCVIGIAFILFGLWFKLSVYFDDKNRIHVSKWMDSINEKLQNGEKLSLWESINWYSKKIGIIIQKISLQIGSISLIIACVFKGIN